MRSRGAATLIACLMVLPAAGCYQGPGKTVNDQEPTGNGTYLTVGETLEIQNLTVVAGKQGDEPASVVMTLVNNGDTAEGLTEVQVSGSSATVATAPIAIAPAAAVPIGGTSTHQVQVAGLETPTGSYATVVLKFQRAGVVNTESLVVPQTSFYEGYGANPSAAPEDAATPEADEPPAED